MFYYKWELREDNFWVNGNNCKAPSETVETNENQIRNTVYNQLPPKYKNFFRDKIFEEPSQWEGTTRNIIIQKERFKLSIQYRKRIVSPNIQP